MNSGRAVWQAKTSCILQERGLACDVTRSPMLPPDLHESFLEFHDTREGKKQR